MPGMIRLALLSMMLALALSGCGQKGPLRLPEPAPAKPASP
jgi:predicted small lipoprotein YifL